MRVPLYTADEIMRELEHGWVHARMADRREVYVVSARRTNGGLWLKVTEREDGIRSEILWGPGMDVWTLL